MSRIALVICFFTAGISPADPGEARPARTDAFGDPLPDGAVARLGSVRWKGDEFTGLIFSADGKRVATVGNSRTTGRSDRFVFVWEFPSGRLVRRFKLPNSEYGPLAFTPDAKELFFSTFLWIYSSSLVDLETGHGTLLVDLETGQTKKRTFDCPAELRDGHRVAVSGTRSVLCVADGKKRRLFLLDELCPENYKPLGTIEVATEETRVEFAISSDSRWIAACEPGSEITSPRVRIWDSVSGKEWPGPSLPENANVTMRFISHGRFVVEAGDGCFFVWNIDSKEQTAAPRFQLFRQFLNDEVAQLMAGTISCSPADGLRACSQNGPLVVINSLTGAILWQRTIYAENGEGDGVRNAVFTPDGRTLAVIGNGGSIIRFFDAATGREHNTEYGHRGAVTSLAFHPSGKMLMSASRSDSTVRAWDLRQTSRWQTATLAQITVLEKIVFADRGRLLPIRHAVEEGEDITFWDGEKFRALGAIAISRNGADPAMDIEHDRIIVSPETPNVAIFGGGLRLIDARNGTLLKHEDSLIEGVPLTFSPDGKTLICRDGDSGLVLWDLARGRHCEAPVRIAANAAQRYFAFNHNYKTLIVDRVRCRIVRRIDIGAANSCLSPDGRYLAFFDPAYPVSFQSEPAEETTPLTTWIEIIETVTGECVKKVALHGGKCTSLCFSPDSALLATGLSDGTILLYDARPPQPKTGDPIDNLRAANFYADLANGHAETAFAAIGTLAANPREAIEVIRVRMILLPEKGDTPTEKKEELAPLAGKQLQTWRAMEVLERIGNRDAFDLLKELRDGADPWLTEIAGDALLRLKARR